MLMVRIVWAIFFIFFKQECMDTEILKNYDSAKELLANKAE